MSKALIEKAFNEWIKYRAGLDKYSAMSAWQAGANWQREQLESKQTKIKCSTCGAEVSSSVPKDTVIRGYVECPECITKTNVATVTHDIYKQAREQLEAEIKELKEQITDLTNGNYKKGIHTMEQLHKIVEDRNKTIDWWTNKGFEDLDKIKDLQAENKTIREQLIKELREWIESNKELRGYTGIPDDTLNIILAKLDLLEKGIK